jgi:hypothetical protein
MDAGASCEKEEEFARGVRVVGGFCYVAVYVVELCDFAGWGLGGGGCFCDLRVSMQLSDGVWIWLTSCFMYLIFFILNGGQLGCDGINAFDAYS